MHYFWCCILCIDEPSLLCLDIGWGWGSLFLLPSTIFHSSTISIIFIAHSTHVPRGYDEALSKWCATQRMRCKEVMNGDTKTPLNKAQFHALQSIGFEMSVKRKQYDRSMIDKKWEERLWVYPLGIYFISPVAFGLNYSLARLYAFASNELLQYKEKHGNCDVAVRKGFEEYKQLANWAGLQRVSTTMHHYSNQMYFSRLVVDSMPFFDLRPLS